MHLSILHSESGKHGPGLGLWWAWKSGFLAAPRAPINDDPSGDPSLRVRRRRGQLLPPLDPIHLTTRELEMREGEEDDYGEADGQRRVRVRPLPIPPPPPPRSAGGFPLTNTSSQVTNGGSGEKGREGEGNTKGGGVELFHVVMMEVAPHAEFGGCGLSGRRAIDGLLLGRTCKKQRTSTRVINQSVMMKCARRSREKRHFQSRKSRRVDGFPGKGVALLSRTIQIPPLYNS